jgi:hypothetical protein
MVNSIRALNPKFKVFQIKRKNSI